MFKHDLNDKKDNPERYWFKRKIWGWGFIPLSWQGWLVTLLYCGLISLLLLSREEAVPGNPDSGSNFLVFGLPVILLTALWAFIIHKKGKKPKSRSEVARR